MSKEEKLRAAIAFFEMKPKLTKYIIFNSHKFNEA